MSMTDPIADLLTRIRNANQVFLPKVDIPKSKLKLQVIKKLKEEGFIKNYKEVLVSPRKSRNKKAKIKAVRVFMKYSNKDRVIKGIKRISKPSLRVYSKFNEIPRVLNGLGVALVSTSKGLLTDREARKLRVGGEIICHVW